MISRSKSVGPPVPSRHGSTGTVWVRRPPLVSTDDRVRHGVGDGAGNRVDDAAAGAGEPGTQRDPGRRRTHPGE
ncbi:MAG: hypothetical protein FJ308_24215 [Planctomycetes bacterium]|nr:hypothetical protein [Planctomycetota bacterium]